VVKVIRRGTGGPSDHYLEAMAEAEGNGRQLAPEQLGARVEAILGAAERDARAVLEAARREAYEAPRDWAPIDRTNGSNDGPAGEAALPAELAGVTRVLELLSSRVDAIERMIDERLEILWRTRAPAGERPVAREPAPLPSVDLDARTERLRAVDLALRGVSRAQIAAELRSMMSEAETERLLDNVLDPA
jgi:hypothetical protein